MYTEEKIEINTVSDLINALLQFPQDLPIHVHASYYPNDYHAPNSIEVIDGIVRILTNESE